MNPISKEQQPQFHLILPEFEDNPGNTYLRNLLWLGKMTAVLGQYPPGYPTEHVAYKMVESCTDRREGFEIGVGFLIKPRTLRLDDFDYPYISLDKRGNNPDPSQKITYRPERVISVGLKSDGLIILTVKNFIESKREYEEALQYEDPPEITDKVYGVTRRVQWKFSSPSFISYSVYPPAVYPQARELLNKVTSQAVEEFKSASFILPLSMSLASPNF